MSGLVSRSLAEVASTSAALVRELGTLAQGGPRAQDAARAAAAVILAAIIAIAMSLPDPWWATVSAAMSTMPTRPASLEKGVLRIIGTLAGALSGYLLIGWVAYDHVACCLVLFAVSSISLYGMAVSPHSYAWMLLGITFNLVVLSSLNDPSGAFHIAVYRFLEVLVGTGCALLVAVLLAPEITAPAAPAAPGWRDPFGANWPAVTYAMRSGVAVAVLPVIWNAFNLPGVATMAITVAAVMAVPMLPGHVLDDPARILSKAAYRLLGCFIGGVVGLLVLALSTTVFLFWLVLLAAGTWLFVWMQGSTTGAGYVGTQANMVYIMTLVQGLGPPLSLLPGFNRFAGITLGVLTLLLVTAALRPIAREVT